jgi:hypothetical protein
VFVVIVDHIPGHTKQIGFEGEDVRNGFAVYPYFEKNVLRHIQSRILIFYETMEETFYYGIISCKKDIKCFVVSIP